MEVCSGSSWGCILISWRLWWTLKRLHRVVEVVSFATKILVFPSVILHLHFMSWWKYLTLRPICILSWVHEWYPAIISALDRQHVDLFPFLLEICLYSLQPSNRLFLSLEQPLIRFSSSILLQYLWIIALCFINKRLLGIFPDLSDPITLLRSSICCSYVLINPPQPVNHSIVVGVMSVLRSLPWLTPFLLILIRYCCNRSTHAWLARVINCDELISHFSHVMMVVVTDQSQLFLKKRCFTLEETVYFLVHSVCLH